MLCEECGKNQATVAITVSAGGEVTTRRLCPECMKKMQFSLVSGDIQGFLSSVLSVLGSGQKVEEHTAVCSGCGLSYAEFERTGRLGCAQCYRDFSDQLKPLLQRIHGRAQHAGRRPPLSGLRRKTNARHGSASFARKWMRLWQVKTLRTRQNTVTSCESSPKKAGRRNHERFGSQCGRFQPGEACPKLF